MFFFLALLLALGPPLLIVFLLWVRAVEFHDEFHMVEKFKEFKRVL